MLTISQLDAHTLDMHETHEVIAAWLASIGSRNTREAYRNDVTAFTEWCQLSGQKPLRADPGALQSFRAHLHAGGAAPSSVARRMSAVNGLLRFADGAPRRADTGASTTVPLTDGERDALLDTVGSADTRTHVLVSLLLLDGLKLDEALRLDTDHVEGRPPRRAVVTSGRAARTVELHPDTAAALARHLRRRRRGAVLTSDSPSREEGARLTRFGADYLLKEAGRGAGLEAPLTANALRRTHVIHSHRHGRSVDDIRRQVGHDDIRTTRRYLPRR